MVKLVDRTPAHLRCTLGACPSVHQLEDGQLVIIGKHPSTEIIAELMDKIREDEDIIVIDKAYFADILPEIERQHTEELQRQAREGAKETDIVPYMAAGFSPLQCSPAGYRTLDDGTLVSH